MYRIRADELPQYGMSRVLVGAERGDVAVCADLVNAPLGKGPPPHRHPYDKVAFVQAGRAKWTVNGEDHDAQAGDILVVKAGEIHSFLSVGDEPLVQLDIHLGPRFVQENV